MTAPLRPERQPADATLVGQPLRAPMPDASTPPEAPIEKMELPAMEKKEKLAPRFKNRDEWRAHMDALADDGKWSKRNWTK